jgi:hypothetical protein
VDDTADDAPVVHAPCAKWLIGSSGSITDHCRSESQNSPAIP